MPVIPTFVPAQAPDTTTELNQQAQGNEQSWMTQAANRQETQARTGLIGSQTAQSIAQTHLTNIQTAEQNALLPALQAKSDADVLQAQNDGAAATIIQQLRGQWQGLKPQVVADMGKMEDPKNQPTEPDGTPDWNAKYNAYEGLLSKYSALSMLPEGKPYYDQIQKAMQDAHQMAFSQQANQLVLNKITLENNNALAMAKQKSDLEAQQRPAIAAAEAFNTRRNKAFDDIATQRAALNQASFSINGLTQDLATQNSSTLGSGPIVGSPLMASLRAAGGDASAQQVQADIGDFANKIMSTVKNIRNVNEFNAVTASIPKPGYAADVQNRNMGKLDVANQVLTQRNDLKEKLLRANPNMDPDQADEQASQQIPFPASVMGGGSRGGGSSGGGLQQLSPADAAKLPPGTHFLGTDGVERVKQ